jgi:hypothetical protein
VLHKYCHVSDIQNMSVRTWWGNKSIGQRTIVSFKETESIYNTFFFPGSDLALAYPYKYLRYLSFSREKSIQNPTSHTWLAYPINISLLDTRFFNLSLPKSDNEKKYLQNNYQHLKYRNISVCPRKIVSIVILRKLWLMHYDLWKSVASCTNIELFAINILQANWS